MKHLLVVLFIATASAMPVMAQSKESKVQSDIRKAIEAASKKFNEVFTKGDAAGLAAMYAKGAKVLPPNGTIIESDPGILELWRSFIGSGAKLSLGTTFVDGRGDLAYEVGTYSITTPDGGKDTGKFVVVWKRQNGVWKIAADIWNSDLPTTKE